MSRYVSPRLLLRVAVAVLVCSSTLSCGGAVPIDTPGVPRSATGELFFTAPGSPWTTPVPADAPADPRSAAYVARLAELKPAVAIREYTIPVFVADSTTPRYNLHPSAYWAPPDYTREVRIPDYAIADPADDAHLAVLDRSTRCLYEFYRAYRVGDGWRAEWVNATPIDGDGIYPDGLSTRASGLSSAAGLIWPEELRSGQINHALVFAYRFTRAGGPVGMATRSDGRSDEDTALPIGARLVLDPALDIDALNLSQAEHTIAKALQRYGMVLADSSGGFAFNAVHPNSFAGNPYAAIWGDVPFAGIGKIPFHRMKVLPLGEQKQRYEGPPIPNRCTNPSG